jgi:hypothetical protein
MKLTKIIPLCCSILLLGSCNNETPTSSGAPAETTTTPEKKECKLTSIDPGKIYIDINLSNPPEGFKIKYADKEITASTLIEVPADTKFTIEGTLDNVNFYRIQEVDETASSTVGVSEHVDETVASEKLGVYLEMIAKTAEGKRNYFCVTDTDQGWSKTIPGVNAIITSWINTVKI